MAEQDEGTDQMEHADEVLERVLTTRNQPTGIGGAVNALPLS